MKITKRQLRRVIREELRRRALVGHVANDTPPKTRICEGYDEGIYGHWQVPSNTPTWQGFLAHAIGDKYALALRNGYYRSYAPAPTRVSSDWWKNNRRLAWKSGVSEADWVMAGGDPEMYSDREERFDSGYKALPEKIVKEIIRTNALKPVLDLMSKLEQEFREEINVEGPFVDIDSINPVLWVLDGLREWGSEKTFIRLAGDEGRRGSDLSKIFDLPHAEWIEDLSEEQVQAVLEEL